MKKQDIGLIGLGVMGRNLTLNIESRGYGVVVYNYLYKDTENFLKQEANNKNIKGTKTLEEFVNSLKKPRRIMLMVKAGAPTDDTINALKPYLEQGDIVIDGGNTLYEETERRNNELSAADIHFIGTGVSGGEEGALTGPSLMPGGHKDAYELIKPIFEAIAARVEDNSPCVTYIGPGGAGHFVKMVHNGIEYGDMQLIAEAYFVLKRLLNLSVNDFHKIFTAWNQGELNSYLIKITADIFTKIDDESNEPLIDKILDSAAQKGTGKWTSKNALDLGVPLPLITESVFARFISSLKSERLTASKILKGPAKINYSNDKEAIIETVRKALYMSKITSYAQGFAQLKAASTAYNWNLHYGDIARIWRGGCIIRARFLEKITEAFDNNPELENLMLDSYFSHILTSYQEALREVTMLAIKHGIATPAFSSAIAYYDSYRTERLPANLIQAQRDYFGAHTFKRIDKEGDFHAQWY